VATYHLSVKFGGKGQAANHADYIERKEKYRDRQDLEYSAHGNMPEWARDNPSHFWQAADQFERANGSTYRELEIALPRELPPDNTIPPALTDEHVPLYIRRLEYYRLLYRPKQTESY
jgi:hypothetical protein